MKESRLFQILYYILEKGRVTAPELAEKFEVSVRTIYRDIDWISSSGIPIYTTQGKGGGIEIDSSFILNKSMLTADEKEKILLALSNTNSIAGLEQDGLLSKLSSLFKLKNTKWIEVDEGNWLSSNSYQIFFEDIKFSIINKRFISFDYSSNKLETTRREVKPIRLVFKAWSWYLYAFCTLRKDFRFFKLSRMKNMKVHAELFDDDFNDLVISKEYNRKKPVHLTLRFHKSQAYRVYDELSDNVLEDEDYLLVEIDLPSDYVYTYILSFGDGVEVLAPEGIRIGLKHILEKIVKKYRT